MNRRTVLKGGLILAATAHTAAGAPEGDHGMGDHTTISVDAFLAKATPTEKALYHANALAEAMNETFPGDYLVQVFPKAGLALVEARVSRYSCGYSVGSPEYRRMKLRYASELI